VRESRNEVAEKIIISAESLRRTCAEGVGVKRGGDLFAVAIVTMKADRNIDRETALARLRTHSGRCSRQTEKNKVQGARGYDRRRGRRESAGATRKKKEG